MVKVAETTDVTEAGSRRIHIMVKAADCPGFLKYLDALPFGAEAPLIRAVLFDWFRRQIREGTLDSTVEAFIENLNAKKKLRINAVLPKMPVDRHSLDLMASATPVMPTAFAEGARREPSQPNTPIISEQNIVESSAVGFSADLPSLKPNGGGRNLPEAPMDAETANRNSALTNLDWDLLDEMVDLEKF